MDYTMPRADDLPSFQVSTSNTPCPGNPLGIKGCGEAGAIGSPPAVINAITNCDRHQRTDHACDAAGGLVGAEIGDTALRENHHVPDQLITVLPPSTTP